MSEEVKFIADATAMMSMRDSDFDAYSAYGEVIDNSIQAGATWIKIHMDTVEKGGRGRSYRIIKQIAFGDNGCGMSPDVLHRCLQLGYSSRYNDRSGIGRFGVGMTLASINQCRRIEIYSRCVNGDWFWTYVDLKEIFNGSKTGITAPIRKNPPAVYNDVKPESSGTIVVWMDYDRQPYSADTIEREMHVWFGRTYRYFIWDGVSIFVNKQKVYAIDPLYVKTEKTEFEDDPVATEYDKIVFPWKVSSIDAPPNAPDEAPVTIRMSILPEQWRKNRGDGGSPGARKRFIDRNEGISIIRNRREVFYGHIPYFTPKFEEIDRWWGCEISFEAVLDREFTVKNIKRGALPNAELREVINDKIRPTRRTIIEEVKKCWAKSEAEKRQEERSKDSGVTATGHEYAESIAKKTTTDRSALDANKDVRVEAPDLAADIFKDKDKSIQQAWAVKFASQPFTITEDQWRGVDFFETNHLGGKDVLRYNLMHPFFIELNKIMDLIHGAQGSTQTEELYHNLKAFIDLLIISYSKAETKFDPGDKMSVEDFIETLRNNWGHYLKQYLNTWKADQTDQGEGGNDDGK